LFIEYNKKQELVRLKFQQSLPSVSNIAAEDNKIAVVPTLETSSSQFSDMPGDADDFLARLTSVPSPVRSEFSDYGSMPRSPASVSGLSG
jgi:hypothetical protein